MLFLLAAALVAVLAGICFWRGIAIRDLFPNNDWGGGGVLLSFIAVIVVILGFVISGAMWAAQIDDFENIKKYKRVEAIYQAKAGALTAEFTGHLAKTYPEHEKEIYDKISPDRVSMYFAKYPELRTSETLVALVEHINKLQADVYDQQINVEQALQRTRFRLRNPWFFTFMIPTE